MKKGHQFEGYVFLFGIFVIIRILYGFAEAAFEDPLVIIPFLFGLYILLGATKLLFKRINALFWINAGLIAFISIVAWHAVNIFWVKLSVVTYAVAFFVFWIIIEEQKIRKKKKQLEKQKIADMYSKSVLLKKIDEEIKQRVPNYKGYHPVFSGDILSLITSECPNEYIKKQKNSEVTKLANAFYGRVDLLETTPRQRHPLSMLAMVQGYLKGVSGEMKALKKMESSGVPYIPNAVIKSKKGKAELDILMIGKNTLYTFECKDYYAKEIVLNSSGCLYKTKKDGTEERIDVLSQIERHNTILRSAFGKDKRIINCIVITDENTKVINQYDSPYFKIIHVDMLSFYVSQFEDVVDDFSQYEAVKGEEREYDHPDLVKINEMLDEHFMKEIKSMKKFVENFPKDDLDFEKIKEEISNVFINDKMWLTYHNEDNIRNIVENKLNQKIESVNQHIDTKESLIRKIEEKTIEINQAKNK